MPADSLDRPTGGVAQLWHPAVAGLGALCNVSHRCQANATACMPTLTALLRPTCTQAGANY